MEFRNNFLRNINYDYKTKMIIGVYLFLTLLTVILAVKFIIIDSIDSEDYVFGFIYFLSYFLMFWFIIQQSFDIKAVWIWFMLINIYFLVLFFEFYPAVKFIILLQLVFGIIMNYFQIEKLKEKNNEIQYLSYHDGLTGVHNRRFFQEQINKMEKLQKDNLSVIVADINNLKYINDSFGHSKGDEYIKKAAKILSSELRKNDIIARIGGDEFAILLPESSSQDCKKIIRRFKKKIAEQNHQYFSIAFGFASDRSNFDDLELMISKADKKMYNSKKKMKSELDFALN